MQSFYLFSAVGTLWSAHAGHISTVSVVWLGAAMFAGLLTRVISWFSLPVLALLAAILFWRKAPREFPYFCYYVLLGELVGLSRLLALQINMRVYFYVFWLSDVLIAIFAFLVTYELFIRRLFPQFYEIRFYRWLFPSAGLIIAGITVPVAILARRISLLLSVIHTLEIARVTVLLFFVGLMVFMGRRWRRYEFGIALGLSLQASAMLITSAIWSKEPWAFHLSDRLPVYAYDLACIVWLLTFLKPETPTAISIQPVSAELLADAIKWEDTLKDSLSGRNTK